MYSLAGLRVVAPTQLVAKAGETGFEPVLPVLETGVLPTKLLTQQKKALVNHPVGPDEIGIITGKLTRASLLHRGLP